MRPRPCTLLIMLMGTSSNPEVTMKGERAVRLLRSGSTKESHGPRVTGRRNLERGWPGRNRGGSGEGEGLSSGGGYESNAGGLAERGGRGSGEPGTATPRTSPRDPHRPWAARPSKALEIFSPDVQLTVVDLQVAELLPHMTVNLLLDADKAGDAKGSKLTFLGCLS